MSARRRWRGVAVVTLAVAVVAFVGAGCRGGGEASEPASETDPMYRVSDNSTFTSSGEKQGDWYWLRAQDQQARWDFQDLPAEITDLTTQLRVLVPPKVTSAHFYVSYGIKEKSGDKTLARAEAKLPVKQTDQSTGEGLASYDMTIPVETIPAGTTALWVQASLIDESKTRSPIDAEVAFRKESVRFRPLILASKPAPAGDTAASSPAAGVPPPPTTSTTTTTTKPPTLPPQPFTANGDYISGWYWLRDSVYEQSATWTLTARSNSPDITLDLEVLATSTYDGPRGVNARFYLSYGVVPEARPAASIPTQLVTLTNVSSDSDPVGYTNRGTVTLTNVLPIAKNRKIWVKITRADVAGANPVSEHIAVNEDSVTVHTGTTTTTGGETTTTGTTSGETTTGTTTTTGGETTTTTGGNEVLSCESGSLRARSFAPVESAARWWTDSEGQKWFLIRTDSVSGLPEGYVPINQTATWKFDALPGGGGDVRVRFTAAVAKNSSGSYPNNILLSTTYGAIPAPAGADRLRGVRVVRLDKTDATPRRLPTNGAINQAVTTASWDSYAIYVGETVLPRAPLNGASGYWIRAAMVNPIYAFVTDYVKAALNEQSARVCTEGQPTVPLTASSTTSSPTVSWDKNTKTLTSGSSIFTDLATDPDGDGINQNFENTAAELINPVLEFDESEEWLTHRSEHPAVMLVGVTPWPSYANAKYVVFEFLPTYAYDAGFGYTWNDLQITSSGLESMWTRIGYKEHRGDSEKIYEAFRVVDDTHLQLDWVATSAHDNGTMHNAVWSPKRSRCNVGNQVRFEVNTLTQSEATEVWCSGLEFDGPRGELVVYPALDKHAVYPTKTTCEQVTLVKITITNYVTTYLNYLSPVTLPTTITIPVRETCGFEPLIDPGNYDGDSRYLGNGHWRFSIFNVGEPGNWLIDDLSNSSGWRGLSSAKIAELVGKFPNEDVWTGFRANQGGIYGSFCGGLPHQVGNHTYPDDCSSRIGAKFDSLPEKLLTLLKCSNNGAECAAEYSGSG